MTLTRTRLLVLASALLLCAAAPGAFPDGESPQVLHEFALPRHSGPRGIAIAGDGSLWVVESTANAIAHVDATSGNVLGQFPIPTADAGAQSIARGPGDTLVFTESKAAKIGTIAANGTIVEHDVGCSGCHPGPLAVDRAGNAWFGEINYDVDPNSPATSGRWGPNVIGRMSPDGRVAEFAVPTKEGYATSLVVARDGTIWFTEARPKIGHMASSGAMLGEITTVGIHQTWIGEDAAGVLRVLSTDTERREVGLTTLRQNADGSYRATTSDYSPLPGRTNPVGGAFDRKGNIWFADFDANRVGRASENAPAAATDLNAARRADGIGPSALAAAADGTLWIAETLADRLVQIRPR